MGLDFWSNLIHSIYGCSVVVTPCEVAVVGEPREEDFIEPLGLILTGHGMRDPRLGLPAIWADVTRNKEEIISVGREVGEGTMKIRR